MSPLIKQVTANSPKDIVILASFRSQVTKAKTGGLSKLSPEEVLKQTVKRSLSKIDIPVSEIDDVLVGIVLQTLGGQKASAVAIKAIGFSPSTTVNTVNRQCSSSIQALWYVANSINAGDYKMGIACGVESMSSDYFPHRGIPVRINEDLYNESNQEAKDVIMAMGITSGNIIEKYGLTRLKMDKFSLDSHKKAHSATVDRLLKNKMIPIQTKNEDGEVTEINKDDGIESNISLEKLMSLKPAFKDDGLTTAGNSSQISDGGSFALLTTGENATLLGLEPIAKYIGASIAGVDSKLMGIVPAFTVPQLLTEFGLTVNDIDKFELNEAFASQALYVIEALGLESALQDRKVNRKGGSIAFGHPLRATGLRCLSTLLHGMDLFQCVARLVKVLVCSLRSISSFISLDIFVFYFSIYVFH